MVIGKGLIAQTFSDYISNDEILIFASGVSNSTEMNPLAFKREFDLVKNTIEKFPNLKFVYFSTVSIDDFAVNDRLYIKHKLRIEKYIKNKTKNYLILRVSNVVGSVENPHTIMNFLANAVKDNIRIDIWKNAERNILDKDDLKFIVDSLFTRKVSNETINIASNESILVPDIVIQLELYFQRKSNVNYVLKGNTLDIDVSYISEELLAINLIKGSGLKYIYSLLEKYY